METSQQCRDRAEALRITAEAVRDDQARESYEAIIRTWLELADRIDARIESGRLPLVSLAREPVVVANWGVGEFPLAERSRHGFGRRRGDVMFAAAATAREPLAQTAFGRMVAQAADDARWHGLPTRWVGAGF